MMRTVTAVLILTAVVVRGAAPVAEGDKSAERGEKEEPRVHKPICVYVNCEPVEDFLASGNIPHIISHCSSCYECKHLNFSTCTNVHTKDTEAQSHCVCGNTLPSACDSDHHRLTDILDVNATTFNHDYVCSFPIEGEPHLQTHILPHLDDVHIPNTVNETGWFRVPVAALHNSRRYGDLRFRSLSFYLLNGTDADADDYLTQQHPAARVHLSEDGIPTSVEPVDSRMNVTEWPLVTFPVPATLPTAVVYTLDHPFHRLIEDPQRVESAKNVSVAYRQLTRAPPPPEPSGPNYTLIVLIVVGIILLIGLCCAGISCNDKMQHRRYQRTIEGEVATKSDPEMSKSVAVSGQHQSYLVKNGTHPKEGTEHERAQLLRTTDRRTELATLPLSSSTVIPGTPGSHRQQQYLPHQQTTLPIVIGHGSARPLGDTTATSATAITPVHHRSGSKMDVDPNERSLAAIEADRRKYLAMAKEATVIRAADVDLLESIGTGDFGVIRRGFVFDRTEAMIHCLKPPHKQTNEATAELLNERLESSVKAGFHPNIISLLGLCHEADVLYVCLQLETGPNLRNMLRESRSLDQFLQYTNARGRLSLMSPQRLLNIILGVARGMGHLEESQVLHDNLAAVNIVICDNGNAKIAGFGMATLSDLYMRQLEKNHDQLRWLPPETHDTGLFTMKSQTWSFGVVLWEIVTFGGSPYYEMTDDDVVRRVAAGYRLQRPSNCSRQLYDLMEQCWRARGDDRPDFLTIQQHVHELNLDPELHVSVTYHDGFAYQPIRESWNT